MITENFGMSKLVGSLTHYHGGVKQRAMPTVFVALIPLPWLRDRAALSGRSAID
jgi:hypothetical protein